MFGALLGDSLGGIGAPHSYIITLFADLRSHYYYRNMASYRGIASHGILARFDSPRIDHPMAEVNERKLGQSFCSPHYSN